MKKKIPPHIGEIFAIVASFGMGGFTLFTSFKSLVFIPLAVFYFFIGFLRLILLVSEVTIVKKNDSQQWKFRKERWLQRATGLIILVFNSMFTAALIILATKAPSDIFGKYRWLVWGYAAFTLYKFIFAFYSMSKERKLYSPYKETISTLSFISAMMTVLTLEVTLVSVYGNPDSLILILLLELMSTGVIGLVIFILGIKLLVSRRVPKEIK